MPTSTRSWRVLLGWVVAGEAVTLRTGLAALGIVGAVAVIIRFGGKREQEEVAREVAPDTEPVRLRAGEAS